MVKLQKGQVGRWRAGGGGFTLIELLVVIAIIALLVGILTGKDRGPRREIVVMNAAAAFQVAGLETTWEGGRARAEEAIDSGRAAGVLAALRAFA
jgi:prepilin-type N-terminal cleavage/methylation domain-containing protein